MSDRRLGRCLEHLRRFGLAFACSALGLHPAQLRLDETMAVARAGILPAARWARRRLARAPGRRGRRLLQLIEKQGRGLHVDALGPLGERAVDGG
jgi:hypothetical protein